MIRGCIGRLVRQLWTFILCLCRGIALYKTEKTNCTKSDPVLQSQKETTSHWKADWDEWDTLEVKVEESPVTPPPQEPDLFHDMQPVVGKTKKVVLRSRDEAPDRNQFAVDPTFLTLQADHELGEWPDEPSFEEGGWDEDLPEVFQDSKKMLREKRIAEREHRRQLLHSQTRSASGNLGATRMPST